ncbi:hypothetical protein ACWC2K_36445 [Streptomyces chattanoogensis]|uniref:hypothetical protein n=1 Tax=Streptomyces chattanoogensis TaxID=66876 RepID=UPI00368052D2
MNSLAAMGNPVQLAMDSESLMNFALLRFGIIIGGGLLVVLVLFGLLMIFKRKS